MTESEQVLRRWFEEVWNQGREAAIDEMMDENAIAHGLVDEDGNEMQGPEAFKPFFRQFKGAFPDLQIDVVDTFADGDKVVGRCVVRGTHTGTGLGQEPTGRQVEFSGMIIARIRDGRIMEAWNNFDFLTLNTQLA